MKKIPIIKIVILVLSSMFVSSCELVFDKDLDGQEVELLSPGDNTINDENPQVFRWEQNEDIVNYRVQIVKPDFGTNNFMDADTLVSGTSFSIELEADEYQWRVRGENSFDNVTDFTRRSFTVEDSDDIRNESVLLVSPGDNHDFEIFDPTIKLDWRKLDQATEYDLVITSLDDKYDINIAKSGLVETEYRVDNNDLYDENVSDDDFIPKDIVYEWYVIATNEKYDSQKSETRTFKVRTKIKE